MTTLNSSSTACTGFDPYLLETCAADAEAFALSAQQREENRDRWQEVIDRKLVEWGRDPKQLEDDELVPPSRAVVELAIRLARGWRDAFDPEAGLVEAPKWVVPNGDGGIVFEWREGSLAEKIEVLENGAIECACFENKRLMSRSTFHE